MGSWEGMVIYISGLVCPSTITLVFRSRLMGTHRHPNASVAGIWPISSLNGQGFGIWGSIWADFVIFEIMGGAGDIYNSTSIPNYFDGPYIHLGVYVNEVPSAWTEVWSGSYRSWARFWLPGVVLDRFRVFFRILSRLVIHITR